MSLLLFTISSPDRAPRTGCGRLDGKKGWDICDMMRSTGSLFHIGEAGVLVGGWVSWQLGHEELHLCSSGELGPSWVSGGVSCQAVLMVPPLALNWDMKVWAGVHHCDLSWDMGTRPLRNWSEATTVPSMIRSHCPAVEFARCGMGPKEKDLCCCSLLEPLGSSCKI